jgi:hypothetical protein
MPNDHTRHCIIADGSYICDLLKRYNGIGKDLTNDEREILLFALYNESESREEGIAHRAKLACERIWAAQQK